MIYTDDICKFHAIITDLKNSGVSVHLYGNSTECFLWCIRWFQIHHPIIRWQFTLLLLHLLALYICNSYTKLKEQEVVENAKQLYDQLSVTNAQVILLPGFWYSYNQIIACGMVRCCAANIFNASNLTLASHVS